ncbi:MAG: protein kinase domain-containing protein [Nannocystaceae bacterium]|nr:serine/threonine-protein kinase [bacterium]
MTETLDETAEGTLADRFRAAAGEARALDAERMFASLNEKLFDQREAVSVGRFEVRERLGAGAMGVVMSAFDPQLERIVAVKVLRDEGGPAEQERLLAEARAMAKLRHPNLVTAYEAGTYDDAVFIAMEYVEGGTLRRWLEREPRTWREVVAVFSGAARGLAAIHEAGLVHRDFKPDNVLIGEDGRAQVSDFGLARPQTASMSSNELEISENGEASATHTRGLVGTPNYMSPEQWRGERANAASDQFSFFVALHEALYGVRPFGGESSTNLCLRVLGGERVVLPASAPALPGWLDKLIDRGLNIDPKRRHPSMAHVVSALEEGTHDRRGRTARAAVAAALVTAGFVGVAFAIGTDKPCKGVAERLGETWNEARRSTLMAKFEALGAARTWSLMASMIDERTEDWAEQRRDACAATHVRGEQSEQVLDLRMRCLDRRALELESLVAALGDVDANRVSSALVSLERLPGSDVCADVEFLRLSRPTPEAPEERAAVEELRARQSRLDAAIRAGMVKESADAVDVLLRDATALGYEPLVSEIEYLAGSTSSQLGQGVQAAEHLEAAFEHALATHHMEIQVWASVVLVYVYGDQLRDLEESEQWGRQAKALLRAYDYFPGARRALEANLGTQAVRSRDFDAAKEHLETSLRLWTDAGLADSLGAVSVRANLAVLARKTGDLERARDLMLAARAAVRTNLGPEDSMMGRLGNSLAMTYAELGQLGEAETLYRESIDQIASKLGPDAHPLVHPRNNLAEVLIRRGRYEAALSELDRVVEGWQSESPGNPMLVVPLCNRAEANLELGRVDAADRDLDAAERLLTKDIDPEHRAAYLLLRAQSLEASNATEAERLVREAAGLEVTTPWIQARLDRWAEDHPSTRHAGGGDGDEHDDEGSDREGEHGG